MTDSEEKKEPTTEREEEPTTKDATESPKVGEKRHRTRVRMKRVKMRRER